MKVASWERTYTPYTFICVSYTPPIYGRISQRTGRSLMPVMLKSNPFFRAAFTSPLLPLFAYLRTVVSRDCQPKGGFAVDIVRELFRITDLVYRTFDKLTIALSSKQCWRTRYATDHDNGFQYRPLADARDTAKNTFLGFWGFPPLLRLLFHVLYLISCIRRFEYGFLTARPCFLPTVRHIAALATTQDVKFG